MSGFWEGIARIIRTRYKAVLAVVGAVTVALAVGIPLLDFETSQVSLIGEDNPVSVDNAEYQDQFGGEFMLILFTAQGDRTIADLFDETNLPRLREMDAALRESGQFHAVLSPLTAMEFANNQIPIGQDMFAAAIARTTETGGPDADEEVAAIQARLAENLDRGAVAVAGTDVNPLAADPDATRLAVPSFVRFLLYEDREETAIRPILLDNFPDKRHALAIVYLQGNIDIAEMGAGVELVEQVVADTELDGFTVSSAGAPVFLQDINDYLQGGMARLGLLAVVVMVAVLWFVFRIRWRLLSLAIVVIGAIWTFGLMGYLGIPLTLITISGLPILIGIGVDFSIQTHSRFEEELDRDGDDRRALSRLANRLLPAIAIAMVAATVGFLSLQLSDVPLIRDFGVMLAIGVAALIIAAVAVPTSILVWREERNHTPRGHASVPHGAVERGVRALMLSGRRFLVPLVLIGVAIIAAGLAVEGRFTIQTDPERWIPQDGQTIKDLEHLREETGFSSAFSLLVEADDVTATPVAEWMQQFTDEQVTKHEDVLLRGTSLSAVAKSVTGVPPGQEEIELLLGVAPEDFQRAFISSDRSQAALVFPIAPVSLGERETLIEEVRTDIAAPPGVNAVVHGPPEGTEVTPAGLAVVGVELVRALEANRTLMTWVALGAVGVWLTLFWRRLSMAVLALFPVLTAVGLSSLVTYMSGVELSPLTSVGGPIVIAIATEFSVLVLTRYVEEREDGHEPLDAIRHGAVRIGRAFVASGLTVVGGFGVLALSTFPLLRDFGIVIALDVLAALLSTLVLLPPLLMWADRSPLVRGFAPGRDRHHRHHRERRHTSTARSRRTLETVDH